MFEYTVFDNDVKPVGTVKAINSQQAIEKARRPWRPNPIVENTTLMLRKDPSHKPTTGMIFEERKTGFTKSKSFDNYQHGVTSY
jgi:hypothetical protein